MQEDEDITTEATAVASLTSGYDVLVVEDEARIRSMLSQALKGMGFTATLAPTAEAAGRVLAKRQFDILILDLNLPGMDGLQFLKQVRRQNEGIQVIILTGFGDLEAAQTAIHLDVVEFLTKPCTLGNLEVALDRARKRRKAFMVDGLSMVAAVEMERESRAARPRARPVADGPSTAAMEDMERRHILVVLERHEGNRAAAASELGISLRKLYYRLKEYEKKGLMAR